MHRLVAAIKKEFLQFSRDWMLIVLILWTYTIEVVLCAYALSFEVKNLHLIVDDLDRSQLSQRLIEQFTATEYFALASIAENSKQITEFLDSGKADLGMSIPPDFSEKVSRGRHADVQIILGETNSNTANTARSYATAIIERFSRDLFTTVLKKRGERLDLPRIESRTRIWYNPELKFRYFMVISMIVVAAFMVGLIHIAATMVREKETGTIEQLVVTPLRKHEMILAKVAPTLTIGLLSLFPSLLIAKCFGVPFRGSIPLFFFASAISLFSNMGIGVFISTFSRNLQQALLISFFVIFPVMFLSGTMVPVESMPPAMQRLSLLSPVRYHMEIALGIFLKGVGLKVLWPKFLVLFAFSAAIFPLSIRRLRGKM